ncbi:hypothetical protein RJ640_004016 [Escallonia rubra]|uniref:Uncharacterized protein n=1 Tax=Escallonia rubra TaxID=112253 RepID=A0AA88QLA0_9ASTE|nr:hypothetical protein RJ640_004016 [Escallonia rubra]
MEAIIILRDNGVLPVDCGVVRRLISDFNDNPVIFFSIHDRSRKHLVDCYDFLSVTQLSDTHSQKTPLLKQTLSWLPLFNVLQRPYKFQKTANQVLLHRGPPIQPGPENWLPGFLQNSQVEHRPQMYPRSSSNLLDYKTKAKQTCNLLSLYKFPLDTPCQLPNRTEQAGMKIQILQFIPPLPSHNKRGKIMAVKFQNSSLRKRERVWVPLRKALEEKRSRLYIIRHCLYMLVCWREHEEQF